MHTTSQRPIGIRPEVLLCTLIPNMSHPGVYLTRSHLGSHGDCVSFKNGVLDFAHSNIYASPWYGRGMEAFRENSPVTVFF